MPVPFTLKLRDFSPESTFPPHITATHSLYLQALEGIDANDTSLQERIGKEILLQREFTYGEVDFAAFVPLLGLVEP